MRELIALNHEAPGNAAALERLAVLKFQAGKKQEAEALHRSKAKVDSAQDQFRKALLDSALLNENAERLASLARTLDRNFDAGAWAIIAEAQRRTSSSRAALQAGDGRLPLATHLKRRAEELCAPF